MTWCRALGVAAAVRLEGAARDVTRPDDVAAKQRGICPLLDVTRERLRRRYSMSSLVASIHALLTRHACPRMATSESTIISTITVAISLSP
jgi:hypothetical protein